MNAGALPSNDDVVDGKGEERFVVIGAEEEEEEEEMDCGNSRLEFRALLLLKGIDTDVAAAAIAALAFTDAFNSASALKSCVCCVR